MTFLELAEEVLKTAKEPLTLKQIWEIAISQELDKKVGSKGKTLWTLCLHKFIQP